jgi:hypothetical protein
MAIANLKSIIGKVRRLTGSADARQLPDSADPTDPNSVGITDYINSFYLYDLPAQFRSLKLKDTLTFNTTRGVDTYAFNSEQYLTVEMPCYCAKREIALFQNPWNFYGVNYNWQYRNNFATATGVAGPYSGTTTAHPILRSVNNNPANTTGTPTTPGGTQGYAGFPSSRAQNILITANIANGNTMNVTDDGNGTLIGDCLAGGAIDYDTGAITGLTFTGVIPAGESIQIQYNPVPLSIPLSILFYQNQFVLRPVPDRGYTIDVSVYRQPTQALMTAGANLGTPELNEWWELIATGAAKKIYEDRLDFDGVALMEKMLQEKYQLAYTRTYAQLGKQRMNTIFAEQNTINYGAGWGFGGGAGS